MSAQRQLDTIVHIGAGRCSEFDEYKSSDVRQIILIEPEPETARQLQDRLCDEEIVQIFEKAVCCSDSPNELYLYNVRGFSSLREPTGLKKLFPGLRKTGQLYPDTWSVWHMCEELDIKENGCNWLIVDAPGEEQDILEGLRDEGLLERFEWVSFCAGLSPLYQGNRPAEEILAILEEQGYETISREDEGEPERPKWTLYRDELKVRNTRLEARITELGQELAKLKDVNQEEAEILKAEETEKLKGERERLLNDVSAERKQNNALKEKIKKLSDEVDRLKLESAKRQGDIERIQSEQIAERQEKQTVERELKSKVTDLSKSFEEKNAALARLQEALETEKQSRKKMEAERDDLSTKNEELTSLKKDLEKQNAELNVRNRELQIRQAKVNEELIKGDAQIDLIKELLLPQFNEEYNIDT